MSDSWEWNRMRILDAVARTGSIGHAASLLGMSGPAVSQQIRRLEAECGVRVVEPAGRGIRLTSDGEALARHAGRMARIAREAEDELTRSALAGVVRLAGVASALRTLAAPEIARLALAHPAVRVIVQDGETTDHLRLLSAGHLDLVLAESWSPSPLRMPAGLRSDVVRHDEAVVALPAGHRCAASPVVDLHDLTEDAWATCATGSDAHVALTATAHRCGVDLDVRFHVDDHATQVAFVRAGVAAACLPGSVARLVGDTTGVAFRPLATPLARDVLLVAPRQASGRAAAHLAARLRTPA